MSICSYCNQTSHNIRNCDHDGAILIRSRFRQIISEDELIHVLSRYSSVMLSIVMVMYNARNLSLTKNQKIAFIKERWLSGHPIPESQVEINVRMQVEARQQERLREINQYMIESRRIIQIDEDIGENIYTNICIGLFQMPNFIVQENLDHVDQFSDMMDQVINNIIITTNELLRAMRILGTVMRRLIVPLHMQTSIRAYMGRQLTAIIRENSMEHLKIKTIMTSGIDDAECSICYDMKEQVVLNCKHSFCVDCIENIAKSRKKASICCALCREEVTEFKVHTEDTKTRCETRIIR